MDRGREAVMGMLKDIEQHHFLICHTLAGNLAIVFSRAGLGTKPLIGAYFSGEEWLPSAWDELGNYINDVVKSGLDLDFSQHTSVDPIKPLA